MKEPNSASLSSVLFPKSGNCRLTLEIAVNVETLSALGADVSIIESPTSIEIYLTNCSTTSSKAVAQTKLSSLLSITIKNAHQTS